MPTATTDLDHTLQRIAQHAQTLTLASGAAIALRWEGAASYAEGASDFASDVMTCRASSGDDAPGVGARLRVGSGFSGECVQQGRLLRCDDSEIDVRVDRDSCRRLGIRSIVAVPVKDNESVIGIIEIFSPLPKAFTQIDGSELQGLAEMVASAVQRERAQAPPAAPAGEVAISPRTDSRDSVPQEAELVAPTPEISSIPEFFSDKIFVTSSLPWNRFLQSALWHVVALVAVWNVSYSWARSEEILRRTASENSRLTYYKPSFPTAGRYQPQARSESKTQVRSAVKPLSVRKERAQSAVAAPTVKLPMRGRLSLASWTPAVPARPHPLVGEAPALGGAARSLAAPGRPRLLQTSAVGPAPKLGAAFGERGVTTLAPSVVAPTPTVGLGVRTGWNAGTGIGQAPVVAPAPSLPMRDGSNLTAMSLGGAGAVIAPAPGMPLHERSGEAPGLGGTAAVVGPPPGMPSRDSGSVPGVSLSGTGTSVVPPPPSMAASDNFSGGRGGPLPGMGSQIAMAAPSMAATGGALGGTRPVVKIPSPASPLPPRKLEDPNGSTQELPVRVIGLALALPTSSYFSNYEVFIAERRVAKDESMLIKLVYESRPYQRRMSEYGVDDSRIFKVRLKRDASCDETALQMAGSHYPELKSAASHQGLSSLDQDSVLPCYRTTVDEYRKAVSKKR